MKNLNLAKMFGLQDKLNKKFEVKNFVHVFVYTCVDTCNLDTSAQPPHMRSPGLKSSPLSCSHLLSPP